MEIGARPIEQPDHGGVDVPHFVGARGAEPNLRLRRVEAEPGAPPPVLSYEVVPGRRGRPDLAEPLREDGERAGGDVPVLGRGDHVLDHPDFRWRQPMRRRAGTGRLIGKRIRVLPSPGMEPTRRQAEEPQQRPQLDARAGPIDGAQDPHLGAAVGQPLARQREPRGPQQGQHEP